MDVSTYLARIGCTVPDAPTDEALAVLHRAHLHTVPFENLDIHRGPPIELNLARLFEKIVVQKRGGFCYELNGLFAWLLEALGFEVERLSARVYDEDGQPGPERDHMALAVSAEARWLVDVGFGDSFVSPLRWVEGLEQGCFRLTKRADRLCLEQAIEKEVWNVSFDLTDQALPLKAFTDMCRYHQTSPDSHFTSKVVCTLARPDGRVTLSGQRLIETVNGQRVEKRLDNVAAFRGALESHFGVILPEREDIERLMSIGEAPG